MKRIIILLIVLSAGGGLIAITSSDSEAIGAPIRTYGSESKASAAAPVDTRRTYVADTGMITLGPGELLRMTVTPTGQRSRETSLTATFSGQTTQSVCSGGICTHSTASETTAGPVTLMSGQAASHDIYQTSGHSAVRGMVIGNSPDMLVNGLIIDTTTGQSREANYYSITLVNAN